MSGRNIIVGTLLALLSVLAMTGVSHARGLVFTNSSSMVSIQSSFTGEEITFFGQIQPGIGSIPATGPYDIVILVQGPASDRIVRLAGRQLGIVLNTEQAVYRRLPSYYAVLASRPLDDVAGLGVIAVHRMSLEGIAANARAHDAGNMFDDELVRLMKDAGLFMDLNHAVAFLSETVFTARISLPSNAPTGLYLVQAFVIADGRVVASNSSSFSVRTQGFGRYLARTSQENPVLYGAVAVLTALGTGWLGGVVFRR